MVRWSAPLPRNGYRIMSRPSARNLLLHAMSLFAKDQMGANRQPHPTRFKHGNRLRSFQLEGLNWLVYNWYHHRNVMLADEMGLGTWHNLVLLPL